MDWSPIPFKIIEYESISQVQELIHKNNNSMPIHTFFFDKKYLTMPKIIELGDAGEYNPYHFYFFMIARFRFVDNGHSQIFYYYPNKRNCYLSEQGLKVLPSRFQRITQELPGFYYFELPYCSWYDEHISDTWIYPYVRELYKDILSVAPRIKGKYTYITRIKSGRRRILNESTLTEQLRRLGFSLYAMEDLTLEEQMRLFSSSEVICGIHSAAFANLVFCEPGTKVIEIFYDISSHLHYLDISKQCNLLYKRYSKTKIVNPETTDVDLEDSQDFLNALEQFIKQ